jgi:hypothetical protein
MASKAGRRNSDRIVREVWRGCRQGQVVLLRRLPVAKQERHARELPGVQGGVPEADVPF